MSWADSANESGYQLDRKKGAAGTWSQVALPAANVTSYTDSNLSPGSQYFYRLRAANPFGVSSNSTEATATTAPVAPSDPYSFWGSATGPNSVSLSWSGGAYSVNFIIERRLAPSGEWEPVATLEGSQYSYADTGLTAATAYDYRLKGVNSVGETGYVTTRVTTQQLPLPTVPTITAYPLGATEVHVQWTNVSNENGYKLQRREDDPTAWQIIATPGADVTTYTDTNVVEGRQYFYRVAATNSVGDSAYSTSDEATPITLVEWLNDDFDPELGPGWLSTSGTTVVNGGRGFRGSNALWFHGAGSRSAITLPINTAQGGFIEFQLRAGNSGVDGIEYWENSDTGETIVVEASVDGGAWTQVRAINTAFPSYSGWTKVIFEIPVASRGEQTRFRWRQLAHSGANSDTWALDDVVIRAGNIQPPAAPGYLLAAANSATTASLVWPLVATSTYYVLERQMGDAWQAIRTLPANATGTAVFDLMPDSLHSFRVRAGNPGGLSAPSLTASFMTPKQLDDPTAFGELEFAAASVVAEETATGGSATLQVVRRNGMAGTISVDYQVHSGSALAGVDFVESSGTLTFGPGVLSQTIVIPLIADGSIETVENFTVTISNAQGGASLGMIATATVSIADNDELSVVTFQSSDSSVSEAAGTHSVVLTRSRGTDGAVTVAYSVHSGSALAGEDFTVESASVTFASGTTTATIDIPIIDDTMAEQAETFTVQLGESAAAYLPGSIATHSVTIQDDEPIAARNAAYVGLIMFGDSMPARGWVRMNTTKKGQVTGKYLVDGEQRSFSGTLDQTGTVTFKTNSSRKLAPLPVDIRFKIDALGDRLTVVMPESSAALWWGEGERVASRKAGDRVDAGYFTTLLKGAEGAATADTVLGNATFKVADSGAVKVKVMGAEGRALTGASQVTVFGKVPVFASLGETSITGWLESSSSETASLEGTFTWRSSAGVVTTVDASATEYRVPAKGLNLFGETLTPAAFSFPNGISTDAFHRWAQITKRGIQLAAQQDGDILTLQLDSALGTLKGKLRRANGAVHLLRGVVVSPSSAEGYAEIAGTASSTATGEFWTITLPERPLPLGNAAR